MLDDDEIDRAWNSRQREDDGVCIVSHRSTHTRLCSELLEPFEQPDEPRQKEQSFGRMSEEDWTDGFEMEAATDGQPGSLTLAVLCGVSRRSVTSWPWRPMTATRCTAVAP